MERHKIVIEDNSMVRSTRVVIIEKFDPNIVPRELLEKARAEDETGSRLSNWTDEELETLIRLYREEAEKSP